MESLISADDGTPIAVREIGARTAPITVVFVHGFCLAMDSWAPQSEELSRRWSDSARMVFYDQRGHGASGHADPATYTITQLGSDLDAVIRAVAPTGPLVLVGHSMGGMTIMALAHHHPETLGRVLGVALLSTAASGLTDRGIGRALATPAVALMAAAAARAPWAVQHGWASARRLLGPLIGAPCDPRSYPAVHATQRCCAMIQATHAATIAGFLAGLRDLDERAGLARLAHVPALVICGRADAITPPRHSVRIAEVLQHAELIQVPRAQHMIELEHPALVNDALDRLIGRALDPASAPVPAVAAAIASASGMGIS